MLLGFFFLLLFPSFLCLSLGLGLVRLLDLGLTLGLPLLGCLLLAAGFLGRLLSRYFLASSPLASFAYFKASARSSFNFFSSSSLRCLSALSS